MKIVLILTALVSLLFSAAMQQPVKSYIAGGAVVDMVRAQGKLYVATDASSVDIFDLKSTKRIAQIKVDKITDFMGDIIDSKIFSVDVYDGRVVLLSQGDKGYRRVHIYEAGKLQEIISIKDQLYIAQVKFLDKNRLMLALLSDELIAYDIATSKQLYRVAASYSKFSNFALDEKRELIVVADESGVLKIHKTKDGSFLKELKGQNLDNVFQVDIKNGVIATAGQDRRAVIYNGNSAYYMSSHFLIYAVGLSPSGRLAAYASDEQNNVTLFKTGTKSVLAKYTGNKMTLVKIIFLDEKQFLVASDDRKINLYQIK